MKDIDRCARNRIEEIQDPLTEDRVVRSSSSSGSAEYEAYKKKCN